MTLRLRWFACAFLTIGAQLSTPARFGTIHGIDICMEGIANCKGHNDQFVREGSTFKDSQPPTFIASAHSAAVHVAHEDPRMHPSVSPSNAPEWAPREVRPVERRLRKILSNPQTRQAMY